MKASISFSFGSISRQLTQPPLFVVTKRVFFDAFTDQVSGHVRRLINLAPRESRGFRVSLTFDDGG